MHGTTKRFETETLLKASLPKVRVGGITGVSVRAVHRVRAETDARSAETDGKTQKPAQRCCPSQGGSTAGRRVRSAPEDRGLPSGGRHGT